MLQSGVSVLRLETFLTTSDVRMPRSDARGAAERREHHRLREELERDVPPERADGLAEADLLRPLRDGDEHDVHDAHAAHEKRDRRDEDHDARDRVRDGLHLLRASSRP